VRIYHHGELIKVHAPQRPGGRATDYTDYPAERAPYAMRAPDACCRQADQLGPAVGQFTRVLLSGTFPWARLRQAQKLLRLAERYGAARVNAACARALTFELLEELPSREFLVSVLWRGFGAVGLGDPVAHRPLVARIPAIRTREGAVAELRRDFGRVGEVQLDEAVEHAAHAPELPEDVGRATVEGGDEPFLGSCEERMDDHTLMRRPGLARRLERRRELRAKCEVFPQTVGGAFRDRGAARRRFPLEPRIVGDSDVGLNVSSAL